MSLSKSPIFHPTTVLPPTSTTSQSIKTPIVIQTHSDTKYTDTKPSNSLFKMHHSRNTRVTETTKPTLMTRLRGRHANKRTVKTTTVVEPHHNTVHSNHHHNTTARRSRWGGRRSNRTTVAPVHHQRRKVSLGDKISGAMLRLKGSLTHRPAVKAAGSRRMHGTDGRGSHRVY